MIKVIGVSFGDSNKIYYFLPDNLDLVKGSYVVVQTEIGQQYGIVVTDFIFVDENKLTSSLKDVLRIATDEDKIIYEKNMKDALQAIVDANKFIEELGLNMRILNASFTFDRKQLLFHFIADERVDFRVLAKKLAAIYKTRIELRQIGVRDKAKCIGGIGQCGRSLCCATFLDDVSSVSINMAKNQNLALNPQKINGTCGRLMCCLAYENESYGEYKKGLPKVGEKVKTDNGVGKVVFVDLFNRTYKVELDDMKVIELKA